MSKKKKDKNKKVKNKFEWNYQTKSQVRNDLTPVWHLLKSRILWDDCQVYYWSVFIEVLVHLKDALVIANKMGHRISFTDDIVTDKEWKIKDVTDLISNFRDAACHNKSFRNKIGNNIGVFIKVQGRNVYWEYSGGKFSSEYDDDIAFIMGDKVLYLKRHIERAYNELVEYFKDLVWMRCTPI